VDAEPLLGPFVVSNRESAESIAFEDGVMEVDLVAAELTLRNIKPPEPSAAAARAK